MSLRRTTPLTSCRRILNSRGDPITKTNLIELFASKELSDQIFELFKYGKGRGTPLDTQDLIITVRSNFNDPLKPAYDELCQLLESSANLAQSSRETLEPRDFVKVIAPSGAKIVEILEEEEGHNRKIDAFSVDEVMRFIRNFTKPTLRSILTPEDIEKCSSTFKKFAGSSQGLNREEFAKVVSSKNNFFIDRAFKIMDKSRTGFVSLDEYQETLNGLRGEGDNDGAVRFLFKIYDSNESDSITYDVLRNVISESMEENGMKFDPNDLNDLVWAIWDDAGMQNENSEMTYGDFKRQLDKNPDLTRGLADSITRWCIPAQFNQSRRETLASNRVSVSNYLVANLNLLRFLVGFFAVNFCLFVSRCFVFAPFKNIDGSSPNFWVMLARANGICLNFNSMMLLIFVLRYTLTIMRKIGLVRILPLDHHILLHKKTGIIIFCQAWFHGIMHFVNFALNVVDDPVKFVELNAGFFNGTEYHPPDGCYANKEGTAQICARTAGQKTGYSYLEWILTWKPHVFGLIGGWANPTGVLLISILTTMVICSMPFVRKRGHFEIFYFTHLLYFAYFTLLVLHAPSCWYWLLVPVTIFILELAYRMTSQLSGFGGKSNVIAGIVLPSKVTGLVIKKPPNFKHLPGDWVFIRLPQISQFEWHPFTISSAPENEDHFTLHIRAVGGWTNQLHEHFKKELELFEQGKAMETGFIEKIQKNVSQSIRRVGRRAASGGKEYTEISMDPNSPSSPEDAVEQETSRKFGSLRRTPTIVRYNVDKKRARARSLETESQRAHRIRMKTVPRADLEKPLTIFIDGPYGAPASNIFRAEHAVLIATGIGVTPFSSILQSIMHRFWANKRKCPNCQHKWTDGNINELFSLKKVDFFWINRDQRSFEWFIQLLSQLEIEQAEKGGAFERFLEMHMYMTSALQKNDMRAVGLQLAMDLMHKKEKRDLVTGLRSRTMAGRPNWDKVFKDLKSQVKGPITVFYCGNQHLAKTLQTKCEEFGFTYRKEVF